jgi:heme/copper-type cytochrome/quinol oxidase subunit 1
VLDVLHDWVTTVDHKKIGLMYIGYALVFLVIGGFEALLMRIQLAIPNNTAPPWSSSWECPSSLASVTTLSRS